nr:hypothetical protein [Porphyromonas gingivalis]
MLAPLFPKTRSAIRAFPVCELWRGGFVCKKKLCQLPNLLSFYRR